MKKIKAGDLRHPVTLLRPETVTNDKGRRITSWVSADLVYAAKNDVSGKEFYQAQAFHAEDTVTFTIRWRSDVDATWRVRHHSVDYEILEVNHLGYMGDFMRLKCRLVQGEGSS